MLELKILSPQGTVFAENVDEILLPTEIEILPHHVKLYSKLTEGTVTIKKGSKTTVIALTGGFLEVNSDVVTILSDYAIPAESIQVAKALEAKKRAEDLLSKRESDKDILIAEKELQKSIMELRVAEKIKRH